MALSPEQSQAVDRWLATNAGSDAPLVKALLTAGELSSGDPTAISPKGARGLMQLTPTALQDIGRDPKTFNYNSPSESLRAGTDYVRLLREKYGFTNPLQIAAAYNAGPGAVKKAVEAGSFKGLPDETQAYIRRMQAALPSPTAAPTPEAAPEAPAGPLAGPQSAAAEEGASPAAPPAAPAPGLLATAGRDIGLVGQGALNTVAGLRDLAQAPFNYLSGKVGLPPAPALAPKVANVLANPPTTTTEQYIQAAGEGAPFGVPGVLSSLGAKAGGDVVEAFGGPRLAGELAGGLGTGLVTGARGLRKAFLSTREQAKATAAAADEALTAVKAAAPVTAVAKEQQAQHAITSLLLPADETQRAQMLGAAIQGEHKAFSALEGGAWQTFLARFGGTPVDLSHVGLTAEDIVDHMTRSGVAKDVAEARAKSIMGLLRPATEEAAAETTIPLANAQTLRSELGQIFGKATGATQSRAGQLYAGVDQAIKDALPKEALPAWQEVNRLTRQKFSVYRNRFVKQALDNSPQGAATADSYLAGALSGAWTPQKAVQLRRLVTAVGTNSDGHVVLKDAFYRRVLNLATSGERPNWARAARTLRNPDGLGAPFQTLLTDPRERQAFLSIVDAAAAARPEAKAAIASATQAAESAQTHAASLLETHPATLSVGEKFLKLTGLMAGGLKGYFAVKGGFSLARYLKQPGNRRTLQQAMRTTADSAAGRRILQRLAASIHLEPQQLGQFAQGPQAAIASRPEDNVAQGQ